MRHGRFCGSNVSAREGFEVLAEIASVPKAGQWNELAFENAKLYRWIRYEGPPGSHGNVAEVEFYCGKRRMLGQSFGSFGWRSLRNWPRAVDGKTDTWFDSDVADGQFVGYDVGQFATAQTPRFDPLPGEHQRPLEVALKCSAPGAEIRYSLAGMPTREHSARYTGPIRLEHTATVFAVALKQGMPPSPIASGTFVLGKLKPGLHTLHVGNSLTGSTMRLADFVRTAGYEHQYRSLLKGGGQTIFLFNGTQSETKEDWAKLLAEMPVIDHFTVQPRSPKFDDAARVQEAKYDVLFFNAVGAKCPQFQPWFYAEWPSRRSGQNSVGWAPIFDSQMHELYPAPTFEEASSALLMHIEDIQRKVLAGYKGAKRPRILPCTLAVTRLKNLLDEGKMPGWASSDWDTLMFYDNVHPGAPGRYLLCLAWFAAFYGQSPEGKVLPVGSDVTAEQAAAMQRLAWDVVQNYPDCGLYQEGSTPCGKPEFSAARETTGGMRRIRLSSTTPGAWFRYTLDGTTPTRTHGYVYCGLVSVGSGKTLKAIAYRSGMADSTITAASY